MCTLWKLTDHNESLWSDGTYIEINFWKVSPFKGKWCFSLRILSTYEISSCLGTDFVFDFPLSSVVLLFALYWYFDDFPWHIFCHRWFASKFITGFSPKNRKLLLIRYWHKDLEVHIEQLAPNNGVCLTNISSSNRFPKKVIDCLLFSAIIRWTLFLIVHVD